MKGDVEPTSKLVGRQQEPFRSRVPWELAGGSLLSAVLETSRMEKSRKEGTEIRGCLGLGGGRNGEFLLKVKGFPFK